MPTTITLTIPDDLTQIEDGMIYYLLKDALRQYKSARIPPELFVSRKYGMTGSEDDKIVRSAKVAQTNGELCLADKLLKFDVQVEKK